MVVRQQGNRQYFDAESAPLILLVKGAAGVVDTTKAGNGTNVSCTGTPPAWVTTVPQSRTGWDGSATTKECRTKAEASLNPRHGTNL